MYCSFQSTGKAIAIRHSRKGYILSPLERAHQEEERYRSKSPPSFTLEDLGVTVVAPTSTDCPRRQRKKISNRNTDHNTSPLREESNIPKNIPLEDSPAEMTLQRGRVTLAQILATPTMPQGQAPPRATTTSTPPPAPPVTTTSIAPPPTMKLRLGISDQMDRAPSNPWQSLILRIPLQTWVTLAYINVFMMDGEVLPVTDRVRP